MTTYNRKDIILVPFPFSELTYTQKHPALIFTIGQYFDPA